MACLRVVNSAPPRREAAGDIDDALEILRPRRLEDGLQHPAQQAVALPKALDEIVRSGNLPGGEQMGLGAADLLHAHVVHHRHQVQIDGQDGISP